MLPWILIAIIAVGILIMTFALGTLYGLSDCDTIKDWIKEEYKCSKKVKQDMQAEKAFIKANPVCMYCQKNGKNTKATRMWTKGEAPLALCDEHYKQLYVTKILINRRD